MHMTCLFEASDDVISNMVSSYFHHYFKLFTCRELLLVNNLTTTYNNIITR